MRARWPKETPAILSRRQEPEEEDSLTTTVIMSLAGVVALALVFLAGWMALPGAVVDLQDHSRAVVEESRR